MTAHRVTWFPPDRPVEGNTIYVKPDEQSGSPIAGDTQPHRNASDD